MDSEFPAIAEFLQSLGAAAPLFDTHRQHYEAGITAGTAASTLP